MHMTMLQVSVTLQSECGGNLPIGLVLISDEPITWLLNYGLRIHLITGYVSRLLI